MSYVLANAGIILDDLEKVLNLVVIEKLIIMQKYIFNFDDHILILVFILYFYTIGNFLQNGMYTLN